MLRIEGLEPSTQYHFVARVIDNVGNVSPVSNVAVATTLPVDPPEAHWSFEEGEGTTVGDSSGNGNVGVLTNGARWVEGTIGGALELDGSGAFVTFPDSGLSPGFPGRAASTPGSFSLVAWVQPRSPRYQMVAAKDGHDGRSFNLALRADGLPEAQLFTPEAQQLVGSVGVAVGRWTHLALVHDLSASQVRLYVDGEPAGSAFSGDAIRASSSQFRLGARDLDPYFGFFDGAIDEALVFERALSDQEISSLSRGGVPWRRWEPGCGLGAELAVVLSLLAGLRRRAVSPRGPAPRDLEDVHS